MDKGIAFPLGLKHLRATLIIAPLARNKADASSQVQISTALVSIALHFSMNRIGLYRSVLETAALIVSIINRDLSLIQMT